MENCRVFKIFIYFLYFVGHNFGFTASKCVIDTRILTDDRQPLILLASTRSWYPLTYSERGTIQVPENVSLALVCPKSSDSFNSFQNFYKQNEITAKCIRGNFRVDNREYAFEKLQCQYPLEPVLQVTNQTCLAPNTFNDTSVERNWVQIFVGYPTNYEFIPVYGVCFDKVKLGTLYTVSTIYPEINRNEFPIKKSFWMPDKQMYNHINIEDAYVCRKYNAFPTENSYDDMSNCCFMKSQLVHDADLIYRPQQIATYHYVNAVPQCHKPNWEEVNTLVRKLSSTLGRPLTVWTGVYRYIKRVPQAGRLEKDLYLYYKSEFNKAQPVPFLSWKIIYDGFSDTALAVVTINDSWRASSMLNGLVYCQDVCSDVKWMDFADRKSIEKGYTYCCELESFLKAFAFTKNSFPKASVGLLQHEK